MKNYIILLLGFMTLLGCQKCKSPIKPENECKDLGNEPIQGFVYMFDTIYNYPSLYKEGIVYCRIIPNDFTIDRQFCYYNRQNKNNNIIIQHLADNPSGEINDDWVVFSGQNNCIWKIKINGDSLVRLTTGEGFHPSWNPVTKTISYINQGKLNLISNTGNNILYNDTIYLINSVTWNSTGNKLAFFGKSTKNGFSGLQIYDWSTNVAKLLIQNNKYILGGRIAWAENEEYLIFNADNSIYKIDCQTLVIDTIKKGCESINYLYPFLKNGLLVYIKNEKERIGDTLKSKSGIYQLDMINKKEEQIRIIN